MPSKSRVNPLPRNVSDPMPELPGFYTAWGRRPLTLAMTPGPRPGRAPEPGQALRAAPSSRARHILTPMSREAALYQQLDPTHPLEADEVGLYVD